jgi:hypothetical protein
MRSDLYIAVFPAGKSRAVLDATGIRDMSMRHFDMIPKNP